MLTRRRLLTSGTAALALATLPAPARAQAPNSLVVYYSRTQNTARVVEHIGSRTPCDVVLLETVEPYPQDYETLVALVRDQARDGILPALSTVVDLAPYERVFVGSPIWGNRLSRPVHSFLADNDLSGKLVAPFVTYEVSSGGGEAPEQLIDLCAGADLRNLLTVLGEAAGDAQAEIDAWLDETVQL